MRKMFEDIRNVALLMIFNVFLVTICDCQNIPGSYLVQVSSACDGICRIEVDQGLNVEGKQICTLSNQATIEIGPFFFEHVTCEFEANIDDEIETDINLEEDNNIEETQIDSSVRLILDESKENLVIKSKYLDVIRQILGSEPFGTPVALPDFEFPELEFPELPPGFVNITELIQTPLTPLDPFPLPSTESPSDVVTEIIGTPSPSPVFTPIIQEDNELIETPIALPEIPPLVEGVSESDEEIPSFSIPTESAIIAAFGSAGINVILIEEDPLVMAISRPKKDSAMKKSGWYPGSVTSSPNANEGFENNPNLGSNTSICTLQDDASTFKTSLWNIDMVDGGSTDGKRTCMSCSKSGAGVNIWILDSGCKPIKGGKCFGYYGTTTDGTLCSDVHGHGTNVAGIATDYTYVSEENGLEGLGVATEATRSCIKVLDNNGFGSSAKLVAGIEYVFKNMDRESKGNVINLSIAGSVSFIVNNAIKAAASEGIYFALAAGNDFSNACELSPSAATGNGTYTVEAHDENKFRSEFSNYSQEGLDCTNISAPGSSILSGDGEVSGTSMASPHVAGAIAVLLSNDVAVSLSSLTSGGKTIELTPRDPPFIIKKPSLGLVCS